MTLSAWHMTGWKTENNNSYNGIKALEKCWTKRISVAGVYIEKWQNMMGVVVNCVGLRTFWMPLVMWQQCWLTCEISRKSWLTSIIPPSKSLIASASASIVSMSRWFVGSSSNSRWGRCHASHAKITRQRWPSDRLRIGHVWHIIIIIIIAIIIVTFFNEI